MLQYARAPAATRHGSREPERVFSPPTMQGHTIGRSSGELRANRGGGWSTLSGKRAVGPGQCRSVGPMGDSKAASSGSGPLCRAFRRSWQRLWIPAEPALPSRAPTRQAKSHRHGTAWAVLASVGAPRAACISSRRLPPCHHINPEHGVVRGYHLLTTRARAGVANIGPSETLAGLGLDSTKQEEYRHRKSKFF